MVKFSEKPLKLLATASTLPGSPITNEQLFEAIKSQCEMDDEKTCGDHGEPKRGNEAIKQSDHYVRQNSSMKADCLTKTSITLSLIQLHHIRKFLETAPG